MYGLKLNLSDYHIFFMIMMRKDNHINSNNNVDGSNNHNIAVGSVPSYNAFSMKSI